MMVRMSLSSFCLLMLLQVSSSTANFQRDVVRPVLKASRRTFPGTGDINDALLRKAIPLAEYEANKLDVDGNRIQISDTRRLDEGDEAREDDFYVNYNDMYSFSGYSMKYAKCQPVQYFSEDAIVAGEHSPMITQDIVILRLCPQKSCTESAQYGCHYNYAEYALSLEDYLTVMLKYSAKRRDALCEWCAGCGVVYQGNNANDDAAGDAVNDDDYYAGRRRLDDGQEEGQAEEEGGEDQNDEEAEDQKEENGQNNNNNNNNGDCQYVDDYCYDYDNECGDPDNEEGDGYMTDEEYIDYLRCAEVNYNDYAYFVRPRCDGYKGTIKMAVYYDSYCVRYAGNDVSVKNLGLGFREGRFEDYYSGTCIDCSESDQAPFYDTNTAFCNKIHSSSAKCTSDLLYNLFDGAEDDSTECSYIESIRFGTYDEEGKASATSGMSWSTEVSTGQQIMLAVSIGFCVAFVIYSCYLHHAMTNLLIKSLSHRELLPPSRHRTSRRKKSSSHRHHQQQQSDSDNEDWEKPAIV